MLKDDGELEAWRRRRQDDLKRSGALVGPGYLYRPGEVLLRTADEGRLRDRLREVGGELDRRTEELGRIGLQLWTVDRGIDLPELLRELRSGTLGDEPPPVVAANTVLSGEPIYMGGPGGPPHRSLALDLPEAKVGTRTPSLAVLDTGRSRDLEDLHPTLIPFLQAGKDDIDLLDLDGVAGLDTEAGHGTFIGGLVHRLRPELLVDNQTVLTPAGWGDDVSVALGMTQTSAPVLNLSLGGYTEGDRPPLAFEQALRALGRDRVVVAAAGNNGSDRPFWPAASKHVVAVAALDTTGGAPQEASFSNRGSWVDVCAPGVRLQSAYVRGAASAEDFDGWACWSGTSFAAPLVAAAIAQRVVDGLSPRAAAADLLSGLSTLPGLDDFGVWFDPGEDLVCHEQH